MRNMQKTSVIIVLDINSVVWEKLQRTTMK